MKPISFKISKRFNTTLARPSTITIAKRNVWSSLKKGGEKGIGHAPKLIEALEKKAPDAAPVAQIPHTNQPATTIPQTPPTTEVIKGPLQPTCHRKLPLVRSKDHESILDKPGVKYALQNATSNNFQRVKAAGNYSISTSSKDTFTVNTTTTMSNTIPTPPTMPPKPVVKTAPVEPITEEVLAKAKNKLKPQIPENTKIPNLSHAEPQVVLDKASELAKKLSNSDVIKEMLDRKLFTKDNAMPIEVMTETDDIIVIGKGTEYKLTGIGYAYLKKVIKPLYIENTSIGNDEQNYSFRIAVVNHIKNPFLNSADQTHMLIVFNTNDNTCFSLGYLTSKPTEIKLGDIQFKIYQDTQNGSNMLSNKPINKPQFFVFYDNAKRIPVDKLIFLKGGSDYIQYLDKTTTLNILCEKLMQKAFVNYKSEGITIEQCIKVCIDYDTTVTKQKSHPQTSADILNGAQMAAKKALKKNIKQSTDENISE